MLELTVRQQNDRIPIEAECLVPGKLAALAVAEIEKLPVYHGNRQVPLAELIDVRGEAADGELRLVGDTALVKWIGTGMTAGRITIDGDAGMHLGSQMAGGEILVLGNAGDWVGAEMTGGTIRIRGNAGHLVGGSYRGSKVGMRGGLIRVDGNAGNEVAAAMRRGWIVVGGHCGDYPGIAMIAGSLWIFGAPGIRIGAGMKRGTIALFGSGGTVALLPTFRYSCTYEPTFLGLAVRRLAACGGSCRDAPLPRRFRRYLGDLIELGKGEVLVACDA